MLGGRRIIYVSEPIDEADIPELTPAERDVARLAAAGWSNAEIARERGSSERTIANQLATVYRKLGIGSRVELIARASR